MGLRINSAKLVCDSCNYSDQFLDAHISIIFATAAKMGWKKLSMSNSRLEDIGANKWMCKKCYSYEHGLKTLGKLMSDDIAQQKRVQGIEQLTKPVMGDLFY